MRIVAFPIDFASLRRILAHLGFAPSQPEPLAHSPPDEAETFLASDFTPHAGLVYRNGAAMSLQPHPEFEDDYTLALAELRRGKAPEAIVDAALASVSRKSDSREMGGYLAAFLRRT